MRFEDAAGNEIQYSYDGAGNLTTLIYPDNKTVNKHYDNAGGLTCVVDWALRETRFFYDANARLQRVEFPNGTQPEFPYDFAGRVERMSDTVVASCSLIYQVRFEYDALDRIKREIVTPEPAPFAVTPAVMQHDDDDRLTSSVNL